ncbi:MAG TPA: hypothetical protein PKW52_16295 [Nitrospira sp.]|nr:hypothetical protein [Nitrospira sp. NTP1]HQR16332.1 hypothetical protein [Nitrospira sp.]HQV12900.1 hypothetical protein [Nitrospira sp.]
MRQIVALIGIWFFVVLMQGCAAPSARISHDTVALSEEGGMAATDEEFVKKVERHLDRQDRPGTTLMFR